MLDPKILRTDLEGVANSLRQRAFDVNVTEFSTLESKRKSIQVNVQHLQHERNLYSKRIGIAKAQGEDSTLLQEQVVNLTRGLSQAEAELKQIQATLDELSSSLPNIPAGDVPVGQDENDNVEIAKWGQPRQFDFQPLDHVALGERHRWLDFSVASKLSGARFVVLREQMARLQRALIQFMLDMHTLEHGYQEIYVPYIVNRESMFGTGQLPKFEEDLFKLRTDNDAYLISTAEIPLTNLLRDEIVEESELPLQFVAHTPCFRAEAGSYGRDTRGMIRQHQFEKVELVNMVRPADSEAALETLTGHAEAVLKKLELPYRKVVLCTGDMGFASAKTYDLEVWLPGQSTYREISSCSNFLDFQARRMRVRYRPTKADKPVLLHTLNGSALAVGRTLVALLENYQNKDGSITLPEALRAYMGGVSTLS